MNYALAGQYTVWAILTGIAVWLWILLADAAKRADERDWERQTLRTIKKYIDAQATPDLCDCANEPEDYTFLLRRSFELQAEKNNRPLAS